MLGLYREHYEGFTVKHFHDLAPQRHGGYTAILGRLEVRETTLSAEGGAAGAPIWKGALGTSSPGIVLATLGAVLMGMTITIPGQIATTDTPVYLRYDLAGPLTDMVPPPLPGSAEIPPKPFDALPEPPPLPPAAEGAGGLGAAAAKEGEASR